MACDTYRCLKCGSTKCGIAWRLFTAAGGGSIKGSTSTGYLSAPTVCYQFTGCVPDRQGISLKKHGIRSKAAFGTCELLSSIQNIFTVGIGTQAAFGTPVRTSLARILSSSFVSGAFGDTSVGGLARISPSGITSGEVLGNPEFGVWLIGPSGFFDGAFGTTVLLPGEVSILPPSIESAEAFGDADLTKLYVSPSSIDSGEAFGDHTVASLAYILPSSIESGGAFGDHALSYLAYILPSSIESAEAFGDADLTKLYVSPSSIESGEAFGDHALSYLAYILPSSIESGEAFGDHTVASLAYVLPSSIDSGEAFGMLELALYKNVLPSGVTSGEAFGTPSLVIVGYILPSSIDSGEAFGTTGVEGGGSVLPSSISSGEAFGDHDVVNLSNLVLEGISSGEAFGDHEVGSLAYVMPPSIDSGEAFGDPDLEAADAFPAVENFSFTQVDSTDFEYDWEPFTSDRVIYIEISWDGETWQDFSWIDDTETGPYQQTANVLSGWPEEGDEFVPTHIYYMRVRYQDVYPDPTVSGQWTVLSFEAETEVMTFNLVGNPAGQQPNLFVRDLTNGFDLYQRNPDTVFEFPASVTKMMTALLAYEYHSGDWTTGTITLTSTDCTQPIPGLVVDSAGFQNGDVVTWEALAYAIFLPSAFEPCQAFGRVIGDEIYAAAGNTGTQGLTRFIERMNERAVELGMTNTVYFDTFGGSKTFGPDVVRNTITARDLNTLTEEVFSHAAIRTIAASPTYGASITGGRTTTLNFTNYNRFINGPTFNQSGIKDANVIGGKDGVWNVSGTNNHNKTNVWVSPAGYEVAITTLGSQTMHGCMMDHRGIIYSLVRDFPYLSEGVATTPDPHFHNVMMLVGADGSVVDESPAGRSLTVNSVTVGDPVVGDSTGGLVYNSLADYVSAADSADLNIGTSDATIEMWYTGPGTSVGDEYVFMSKARHTPDFSREWLVNYFNNQLQLFLSTDSVNWAFTTAISLDSNTNPVFFNGAPRHFALVKSGTTWALYIDGERGNGTLTGTPADGNHPLVIGYSASSQSFLGRADEFRFTIGNARYSSNMVTLDPRKFSRVLTLLPTGVATGLAFGDHTVGATAAILPSSIDSGEAFGDHTVDAVGADSLLPSSIDSGEAFGDHIVQPGVVIVSPSSIGSGEAFGDHTVDDGSGGGGLPLVEGFQFYPEDESTYGYNWNSFGSDRVIYEEYSWDGENWFFFSWIDHTETGPYFQTASLLDGWPEAGDEFVVGHTYYWRVRYQDQYPAPTAVGDFVELYFVYGSAEVISPISDLVLEGYDESDAELSWTPSIVYYTYIEDTGENAEFRLLTWYDPGTGGTDFVNHRGDDLFLRPFEYGTEYFFRMRFQNAPGDEVPTVFGPWATVSFVADIIPSAQIGFSVEQNSSADYTAHFPYQNNLNIVIEMAVEEGSYSVAYNGTAEFGNAPMNFGEGYSPGQELRFRARFDDGLGNFGPVFSGYFSLVVT